MAGREGGEAAQTPFSARHLAVARAIFFALSYCGEGGASEKRAMADVKVARGVVAEELSSARAVGPQVRGR